MANDGPTYRIDPIADHELETRLNALVDRLGPVRAHGDEADVRARIAAGDLRGAFDRLDALTDDEAIDVDTAALVELVLIGQAVRRS